VVPAKPSIPINRVDPARAHGVNHLAWIVDTSSSINLEALSRAGAEAQAALDEGAVDEITVLYCDAAVHRVDAFLPGDLIEFNPVGRGGTKFAPASAWLRENEPDISGAVYVTDLDVYSGDFGDQPPFPAPLVASIQLTSLGTVRRSRSSGLTR
jgi:predicted metal-dependent peptidase